MSKFKSDPIGFQQRGLFPSNIFDLLKIDHECFIFADLFDQINTSKVEKKYSHKGQHAFHPGLIISILIYAYSHGISSSRLIEKKCSEDLGFMFISHYNCPNFRVLSDFRKNNGKFFKECFEQTVLLAKEAGLVSLGHVSLDGSKFKADTSKHKAMSYDRLKAAEKELMEEIEMLIEKSAKCDEEEDKCYGNGTGYEIPAELKIKESRLNKIKEARKALEKREEELNPGEKIDDKKQISFADKEARIMGKKGDFDYQYNGQVSVDSANQIIVGEHLSQNANDKREIAQALKEIKETTGSLPDKFSSDNGYFSGANLEVLTASGIDAYIATGKGEPGLESEGVGQFRKSNFSYDAQSDMFTCPQGQILHLKSEKKDGTKTYQANKEVCRSCRYRSSCCRGKNDNPRSIISDKREPLRQAMREKMMLESSHEVYKRRKVIVEPVFGQIKNSGFRRFHVRGFKKASGEFSLVCAVHNIKKIIRAIYKGEVSIEVGKMVQNRG